MVDTMILRERMISEQIEPRGISDPRVLQALREVPRERFVDAEFVNQAYEDRPLPIAEAARTPNLTDAARARLSEIADGHRLLLTPHRSHTDGFFLALFVRRQD